MVAVESATESDPYSRCAALESGSVFFTKLWSWSCRVDEASVRAPPAATMAMTRMVVIAVSRPGDVRR